MSSKSNLILPYNTTDKKAHLINELEHLEVTHAAYAAADAEKKKRIEELGKRQEVLAFIRGCINLITEDDRNLTDDLWKSVQSLKDKGDEQAKRICTNWLKYFTRLV
jgi:hypothetical protein